MSGKTSASSSSQSPASNDVNILIQKFEGQNLQYLKKGTSSAESLTLSFWVRSNKTGTYTCEIYDADNTRFVSKTYSISSADTWEKKTLTFAGDTSGAFNNDNTHALDIRWWLAAGSTWTSGTLSTSWTSSTSSGDLAAGQVNLADSTSNEWYITGIQLEAGTSASEFEFLPYDVNLRRCQRYFQQVTSNAWFFTYDNTTQNSRINFFLKCDMRAVPTTTITITSGSTSDGVQYSDVGKITYYQNGASGCRTNAATKFEAEL